MATIRRFGPELRDPVTRPDSHNLFARMIQIPASLQAMLGEVEVARRFQGSPIVLPLPITVVALTLDPHGYMDEHEAPHPIVCMVVQGNGFMRVGGPNAPELTVGAGDAILWPANVLHMVRTVEESLMALVVEYPPTA